MEKLPGMSKTRDEGLEHSGTHEYRPAADKYGIINIRTEQIRRVKLEEYTESGEVRIESLVRSRKYELRIIMVNTKLVENKKSRLTSTIAKHAMEAAVLTSKDTLDMTRSWRNRCKVEL